MVSFLLRNRSVFIMCQRVLVKAYSDYRTFTHIKWKRNSTELAILHWMWWELFSETESDQEFMLRSVNCPTLELEFIPSDGRMVKTSVLSFIKSLTSSASFGNSDIRILSKHRFNLLAIPHKQAFLRD
ncbi:hypothetical protein Tco_0154940 [Tanacetum coccineum]